MADIRTPQLQPDWPAAATATNSFIFIHLHTLVINAPVAWSDHATVDPNVRLMMVGAHVMVKLYLKMKLLRCHVAHSRSLWCVLCLQLRVFKHNLATPLLQQYR